MSQLPTHRPPNAPVQPAQAPARAALGNAVQIWPADLLEAFCLRMSSQGMCVSRALMQHDRRYGLEQLAHAHNMADDTLRMMAVRLFAQFEARQSGIERSH